jgi:hypothetical protein
MIRAALFFWGENEAIPEAFLPILTPSFSAYFSIRSATPFKKNNIFSKIF